MQLTWQSIARSIYWSVNQATYYDVIKNVFSSYNLCPLMLFLHIQKWLWNKIKHYTGLTKVSEYVRNNNFWNIFCYFLCLLFDDDTVLIADNYYHLQLASDTFILHCVSCKLTTNALKTKLITFPKENQEKRVLLFFFLFENVVL